jgi:hypothetical protein
MTSVVIGPEQISTQHDPVIRFDWNIPINPHSIADFTPHGLQTFIHDAFQRLFDTPTLYIRLMDLYTGAGLSSPETSGKIEWARNSSECEFAKRITGDQPSVMRMTKLLLRESRSMSLESLLQF